MSASLLPLLFVLLAQAPGPTDPSVPTCRSLDGQIACGYSCKSDGLRARCAKTPQGRCQVMDGQVVCFDPPAYVVRAYGSALPEPECKAGEAEVACGYSCTMYFGKMKCARTPAGICRGRGDAVECFDPPAAVFAIFGRETPKIECRSQGTDFACGYHCATGSEGVKCSATPFGVCKSEGGRVTCFDPSPEAICTAGRSLPPPQCKSSEGQAVCGYGCASSYGRVACASTPQGFCKVFDSEVRCFDPPTTLQAEASCLAMLGLAALDGAKP